MKFWISSFIVISLTLLGFSSYFLYKEFTTHVAKTGGDVIGKVTFKKRNASRRYTENVIWEEIAQESDIYNYDAIRTMEYSSAVISLRDGTKIELDQNTMLVVILTEKGLDINFDKGGVSAQSGAGGAVTLNSRDARIALDKGDISVSSSDKGTDIVMNSGIATVASGGKDVSITPDQITTLKDGVVESRKAALIPESPRNNSYIIAYGKTIPVNLSWKSDPPGEVKIEISDNNRFSGTVKSIAAKNNSQQVELSPGDYYWRITRGDSRSQPGKFSVLADRRPELITPHMNENMVLTEGAAIVTFRWEKSDFASMYEVTVARDPKMSDVVLKLQSRINTISTADLEAGTYYCNARSIYPAGMIPDTAFSDTKRFAMEKRRFSLLKPVPLEPGPVTVGNSFSLNWKGVQGAKKYRVEIASDTDFKKNIVTRETANAFIKVEDKFPEGRYYWRVSAVSGETSSGSSETAFLQITKPMQISAVYPERGAVLVNRSEKIDFAWNDPNRGSRYIVEISDKSDFKNIKQSLESASTTVSALSPGTGIYFWRVKLLDASGNTAARSAVNEFSIPAGLKPPAPILPRDNEKILPGFKKPLRFQWSRTAGANEYEVEVFQRIAGAEKALMIYSSKKEYIDLSNTSIYKPGKYSWLVRAKQVKKGKVAAYQESKKSFFEVEQVNILPPPEVKNPGVLFY